MSSEKLGKGLGALFGGILEDDDPLVNANNKLFNVKQSGGDGVIEIPVSQIDNNVNQPRKNFDMETLRELAESIQEHGIIQPILVTPVGSRYMIVAGERRWRAGKMAGLSVMPAVVRNFKPKQIAEIAIIENLQREDLNDMEVAYGIKKLMDEYSLTQEKVSDRIGKNRSTVANLLRLITLPAEVQNLIENKKLSYGHAIRLLSIPDVKKQIHYANLSVNLGLSVRALGMMVDNDVTKQSSKTKQKSQSKSKEIAEMEKMLARELGTRIEINGTNTNGKICISYYSANDLDKITNLIYKASVNINKHNT